MLKEDLVVLFLEFTGSSVTTPSEALNSKNGLNNSYLELPGLIP